MKNTIQSPVTGSENVLLLSSFENSITSYSTLLEKRVDNYLCLDSGLIFNASGARGSEDEFYSDMYDLHSESVHSEFKYESEEGLVGIYDFIVDFITSSGKLDSKGRMLDIGCGKGLLLNKFGRRKPEWDLFAIEPSKNAIPYFNKVMPSLNVFNGNFEDAPFRFEKFDLVTANGVLEHVPDPIAFLKLFRSCISENGIGFIGVPNFKTNPVDLFTYDHLSRFTPETIKVIFDMAGFEIIDQLSPDSRVPMWYVIKPVESKTIVNQKDEFINGQKKLFQASDDYIQRTFKSFNDVIASRQADQRIGVYGTGAIALIGTIFTNLKFEDIHCFLDDNDSLWGTSKYNVPVKSPNAIIEETIDRLVISANPCYHQSILEKLKTLTSPDQHIFL